MCEYLTKNNIENLLLTNFIYCKNLGTKFYRVIFYICLPIKNMIKICYGISKEFLKNHLIDVNLQHKIHKHGFLRVMFWTTEI